MALNFFYTNNYIVIFTSQEQFRVDSVNKPLPYLKSDRALYVIELQRQEESHFHAVTKYYPTRIGHRQFPYGLHFLIPKDSMPGY